MQIHYRPASTKDRPFIVRVSLRTMKHVISYSTGHTLTKAVVMKQLADNQATVIIENGKRPIGFYSYSFLPTGQMYLSALVLVPSAQNRGLGKRVIKRVVAKARVNKSTAILGHVHYTNSRSVVFLLKNGFRIIGPHMPGTLAVEKKLMSQSLIN